MNMKYRLSAANGTEIETTGVHEVILDFKLPKKYVWNFIVAKIKNPILGADFLKQNNLLVDLARKRLIDGSTLCSTLGRITENADPTSIHLIATNILMNERIGELLKKFPSLAKPPQYLEKPPHEVVHHIETDGPPVYGKSRRLQSSIECQVREEFRKMVEVGICRPSKSQWASPLVVVKGKGQIRLAGDYRLLNHRTVPDRYPLPNLFDCTSKLYDKCIFSCIDLIRAFHNIPVSEEDICKTAIISPAGLFEYSRMPFGLRNAPSTFQRFMNSITFDLPFLFCYLDDILVFSSSPDEHNDHLHVLFQRLVENGLTVNFKKSQFFLDKVNFLGHTIMANGQFQPTQERVEYMKQLKKPKTIAALRRVLGVLNFYRRFVRNAAEHLAPLNDLLRGHTRKNDTTPICWTPELESSFEKAKETFVKYTLLHFPNDKSNLLLTCDASKYAYGGVLEQFGDDGQRQPLGFFSGKFTKSQENWAVFDKELYAIYAAVEQFEYLIEGRDLTLVTDHKPLVHMFSTKKRCKLERRSRYIEYISQFTTKISHISGISNIIADMLSRPEVDLISAEINAEKIALAQKNDEEVKEMQRNGWRDHEIKTVKYKKNLEMVCSVIQGKNRPIVPKELRLPLFQQMHSQAHLGFKKMIFIFSSRYFWPGMKKDVRVWCKTCLQCQKGKVTRHTKSPIGVFPEIDRFEHVHVDLVTMKLSGKFRYLFTMIDRCTRWLEAIPLENIAAETVAKAFFEQWIARYGVPLKVTSDRGSQFTSELFKELCQMLGTDHIKTTAYHPQANGMVERVHRSLKNALRCQGKDWVVALPNVLLGLRNAPREESGITSAELVYGRSLKVPGEFHLPGPKIDNSCSYVKQLREIFARVRPVPVQHKSSKSLFIHKDLWTCKRVLVRVDRVKYPLHSPYDGPFNVIERRKKYFKIDLNGKEDTVSIDRLKPCYELADEELKPETKLKSILKEPRGEVREPLQSKTNPAKLREETIHNSVFNRKRTPSFITYVPPKYVPPMQPSFNIGRSGNVLGESEEPRRGVRRSNRVKIRPERYGYRSFSYNR